jgi:hypothetical protein
MPTTLKEKVLKILEGNKHTYAELAKYLNISEKDLDQAFADNSIEIRTLELISKELRIPLYSFFRDHEYGFDQTQEPYYNVNIWGDTENENKKLIAGLQIEMSKLKAELAEKDTLIKKLQEQLSKK